ncbi:hypothetical protein C0J52_00769, partial [Blattella germanica]
LELVIDNLPTLSGQFLCAFTALDKTLITNATRKSYGVNCTTPRTDLLPSIPQGQHHFTAKLSVRMTSGPDFVATNFTFFDCNTYSSCTQCVSSSFPCDWCVDGHRCTHDTAENCRNDILVTGVSRIGPSYRSGPGFCPTINATAGGSPEILVSSGMKKSIRVKVHIIGQFIVQTRFVCQFNIEGRVTSVNAQLLGDTIYCDAMEFSYTSRAPNITATFAVIWGGSKPLDNPDNVHVVIYRCRDMADNCGMCLALAEKYGCGWCQVSDLCEVKEQCDQGAGVWLNRNQTCPNPEVTAFEPQLGPWEGGTNITIQGINLGKTFSDIYGGVSVAGIQCEPYEQLYVKTKQIVCRVDGPGTNEPRKGPVIVRVEDFRGESKHNYEFVDPEIEAISPKYGPRSGGTVLKITGRYMNAGSRIQAFIDDLPCEIIGTKPEEAQCTTSASDRQRSGKLRMKFDKGDRTFDKELFEYVEDPTIESAESGVAGQIKIPKGIPAGGIKISVSGKNLAYIQNPQIFRSMRTVVFTETCFELQQCVVLSNSNMACQSPTITVPETLDAEHPLQLEYGFRMDNVAGVQNLSMKSGYNGFLLYPNPVYEPFDEEVKYYKSDYLTINGQHLDRACQESDVTVRIGNSLCNVTSLSRQQLTCRPPVTQPPGIDEDDRPNPQELPQVVVQVGGDKLKYVIGKLSYASPAGLNGPLSKPALIGVIAGIVLLLFIFVAFLIAYRRKSTESNRVLKNMQEQMDILELRVAAECKEAFAELQTEMTDLTGDLTSGGIPFLDYRTYAMKILFPNIDDHVVLQWERPELLRKEKGLRLFGQLIMNKTFLLLFIRTLESNRYFSMRDRVNVASLIMVTLQSKMEYCTDILKTLLAELIEKCMEGKSHPKLLLRRQSVAEKMLSAWFTFLLYKFLRECAGEPLFMLFRAMKQQVDKGPVDAITSEARYSLSEEKLIRQSIDFKPMTVYVSISQQAVFVSGLDPNTENVPVKVLDCDTISQVKEKALDTIYRATPYSQRPRKDDLDLEWRTGTSGRLILYDEDSTTKTEGEWKKRNTLNHYRVPDGGALNLVSKQSSFYNLSILPEKTDKSHKYETLNLSKFSSASPPLSRATSPLNHDHDGGLKVEQHNEQLKNIILKNEDKQNGPGPSERKKGKFDFTKCSRRHVFLKLLYLGWEYQGFTVQEDTTNTIEHHLFTALVTCCMIENRESSNYHRCGRTDKGVSAFCQVVSLDIRSKFTEEELAADNNLIEGEMDYPKILNSKLPTNIRILGWCPVQPNLSARFDCQQRTYRYIFPRGNLDVASMSIASEQFIGKHDFRNFCKMDVGNGVTNFEREIENISVRLIQVDSGNYDQKESAYDMFEISITGRAYLWHQVRSIMGVLFLIGEGKEKISIVKDLLDVANNPQKPQYQIASDLPLCLFDCNYESVKWICSNEVQVVTIRILQQEWAKLN